LLIFAKRFSNYFRNRYAIPQRTILQRLNLFRFKPETYVLLRIFPFVWHLVLGKGVVSPPFPFKKFFRIFLKTFFEGIRERLRKRYCFNSSRTNWSRPLVIS
jgi:hypothetical protein